MRSFKLRAWNKKTKYLTRVQSVDFTLDGKLSISIMKAGRFKEKEFYKQEDIILLQYVGIVDFDGKELYEGDIIEFTYKEIPGTHVAAVRYFSEHGAFTLYDGSGRSPVLEYVLHLSMLRTEFYVIGNIYENPELLPELSKEKK